jgi:hypothetical protein
MAHEQRPPVFQLHILPMFRLLDREHMLTFDQPGIDLWELKTVWEMRDGILARLRDEGLQMMPTQKTGGPWPDEWVALFERWARNPNADGVGHHLVPAQRDGPYQLQPLPANTRRLSARVIAPTDGCRAWFELDAVTAGQREYTLYLEPALPAGPPGERRLQALEHFDKGDVTRLVVHDAAGTHEVPVT